MNPLTNVKNINKLNETELAKGTVNKKSWHDMYKNSAWIFIGGLSYGLTEGDILSVFSQYGEIVNINLVRDKKTGKIKGFCFLCYANQKSTVLAVDNFNGIKLCGRTIRVDHVSDYKPPKEHENDDEITKQVKAEGCAPKPITIENSANAPEEISEKKKKKIKKEKKKHKKKRKRESNEESHANKKVKVKKEKHDSGYSKYEFSAKIKVEDQREKPSSSLNSGSSSDESSDPDLLSRKEIMKLKEPQPYSDREYDRYARTKRSKHGDCDSYRMLKIMRKERDESSNNSSDESGTQKRSQKVNDLSHNSSSRSGFYESTSKNYDDHCKGSSASHNVENKYPLFNKRLNSTYARLGSTSSSESDSSNRRKLTASDGREEKYSKDHHKYGEYQEKKSASHKRHESSHRVTHHDDSDCGTKSHREKNYQYNKEKNYADVYKYKSRDHKR